MHEAPGFAARAAELGQPGRIGGLGILVAVDRAGVVNDADIHAALVGLLQGIDQLRLFKFVHGHVQAEGAVFCLGEKIEDGFFQAVGKPGAGRLGLLGRKRVGCAGAKATGIGAAASRSTVEIDRCGGIGWSFGGDLQLHRGTGCQILGPAILSHHPVKIVASRLDVQIQVAEGLDGSLVRG